MSEETALAPAAAPAPAVIPPSAPSVVETPRVAAPSADTLPNFKPSEAIAEADEAAPATLTKDGKVSGAWLDHMIARTVPKAQTVADDPEAAIPEDFAEFELTKGEIKSTLGLVNALYTEPNGAAMALRAINEQDPEVALKIAATVIGNNPHYAISQLKAMGFLEDVEQQENHLPSDLAAAIPTELWETAKAIPPTLLRDWSYTGREALIHALKRHQEMTDQWNEQEQKAEAQLDRAIEQAKAAGESQTQALLGLYLDEHSKQFSKWKPTTDEAANATLRSMVFSSAINEMLSEPKWASVNAAITTMLTDAPKWRVYGRPELADRYELEARQLARQSNVRLGQYIQAQLKTLQTIFKGEEEKPKVEEAPSLEAIGEDRALRPGEPPRLDPKTGRTSQAWLDWTIKHLPQSDEQGRAQTLNARRGVTG